MHTLSRRVFSLSMSLIMSLNSKPVQPEIVHVAQYNKLLLIVHSVVCRCNRFSEEQKKFQQQLQANTETLQKNNNELNKNLNQR